MLEGQCLSESGGQSADHDLFLVCACSAIVEYSKNPLIRNHILKNHRLIFLLSAPFYKKLDRLIYGSFPIFFSRTHRQTECQFELPFLVIQQNPAFK